MHYSAGHKLKLANEPNSTRGVGGGGGGGGAPQEANGNIINYYVNFFLPSTGGTRLFTFPLYFLVISDCTLVLPLYFLVITHLQ